MAATSTSFSTPLQTANLGYPRMGRERELKFALESFWKGNSTEADLLGVARSLRERHWKLQQAAGISIIPSNDFSLYDQVLDTLVLLGATPARFGNDAHTLASYFAMARNSSSQTPMEMTKWFDTNYHYLVPEWSAGLSFEIDTRKLLGEIREAQALGIATRPVLLGPVTLFLLGKGVDGYNAIEIFPRLVKAYVRVIEALASEGIMNVQIDEPALVTDLDPWAKQAYRTAYRALAAVPVKLMLTTYFGGLGDNLSLAIDLNTHGLHIDAVRAPQVEAVARRLRAEQVLSLGVVDGRNIWRTRFHEANIPLRAAVDILGTGRILVAPSCSLLHVPHDTRREDRLDPRLRGWLCFAEEKLHELTALATGEEAAAKANMEALADREAAESSHNEAVRARVAGLKASDFARETPYATRAGVQREELGLPLFPTTTIGSFPQTQEVRRQRAAHRNGHISDAQYKEFLRAATEDCIRRQEEIGLDVLAHGEFERNDMVEYFAEYLDGFAFTANGWVQSYGSRCVKPPVIYGDVCRREPMTIEWSNFARSLTEKPVKGMLTGPITVLQWSFVRDDQPRKDTAWQIALALRDEVLDLETAGLRVIQVDEPALREGLPLRKSDQAEYLDWAVKAFRITTSAVKDATQIHTHMCYCDLASIFSSITALDADVISMENARSRMEMLDAFRTHGYPNEIGPGVFDIHSPRVPEVSEMKELLELAVSALNPRQIWVNPDCGLKTRQWPETIATLTNMVTAAKEMRAARNA